MTVTDEQLDALAAYDTPTLANAIGGLISRPANEGYTRPPVHSVLPTLPPMVGRAVTLTIRSEVPFDRPDGNATAMLPLYDAVAQVDGPKVVVVQDLDGGTGCLWGEVNSSICLAAGALGVVTDGLVRDLPDVEAMGFRLLARGVGVARAWTDVVEVGIPVTVGGVTFAPGDVVHADRHGALLIPDEAVAGLPAAADAVMARETTLLEWVRSADFDITQVAARRAQH